MASRRSSAVRARGPFTGRSGGGWVGTPGGDGRRSVSDTTPEVGLWPYTPQKCAGTRMDPPMSLPVASHARPAATAAALPPLEPPGVRVRSHGLLVVPYGAL